MIDEETFSIFKKEINRRASTADRNMYGEFVDNVQFKTSQFSKEGVSSRELISIRSIRGAIGRSTFRSTKPLQEEIDLSNELEDFFGREKYMELFFDKDEIAAYKSAVSKYPAIRDSENPKVQALKDELNPEKLYKVFKYKPRIKYFTEEGVRKMLESPHITKRDKKFLVFNLDQVQDDGRIEINYKEMIYNNFIKQEDNE